MVTPLRYVDEPRIRDLWLSAVVIGVFFSVVSGVSSAMCTEDSCVELAGRPSPFVLVTLAAISATMMWRERRGQENSVRNFRLAFSALWLVAIIGTVIHFALLSTIKVDEWMPGQVFDVPFGLFVDIEYSTH